MKKIFLFALLLLTITAGKFAFGQNVFTINKLYPQDTLINGWIFHSGDNAAWAKPDFDDKQWKPVDPGIDITRFDELKNAGIGWIRVHLQADSNFTKKQLIAWVSQYTASEVYLDGKLIRKYGLIAANGSVTKANDPIGDLIDLNLAPNAEHVLAVKLAYQSGLPYSSSFFIPLPAFRVYINSFNTAFYNYKQNQQITILNAILSSLFAGFFLITTLIYLTYFIFDRAQKIHLYYCIYAFFVFVTNLAFAISVDNVSSVSFQMLLSFGISLFFVISSLLMLLTIYFLFDYKKRLLFKFYVVAGLTVLVFALFNDIWGSITCTNVFLAICLLEGIRISIIALKRKQKGAVFILIALSISCIVDVWAPFLDQTTILATLFTLLATFGFPLGMSVYLGVQNAQTNQKLRFTLIEVQELSAQNLLKEQEKQALLASQNERLELEVSVRTAELNQSLNSLKATQAQLIQSEKMASLGELTAGIAHEIQNPLNFVNNFSEVNKELIEELELEIDKGDLEEIKALAIDIKENEIKINHHGKRADAIVKGMLEHSRAGSGIKEPTDLNKLADEYLRLSYHGLRAKDKSFNAELITHFDGNLPNVNVVPQDIGRVMMNLFNNAFYAVNQKKKIASEDYKPVVEVSTFAPPPAGGGWGVIVKDNGNGIPEAIKAKIMQPFFTTKPTGEGTGLGLSLTYDMVVKGHGGSIQVNSIEGEGSEFIIQLPVN
jgi:two-component system, NtrC family, sensor kinase